MELKIEKSNLTEYLKATEIIDYGSDNINILAQQLNKNTSNEMKKIQNVYEYVRDQIAHSADIHGKVVTCRASEVLAAGEGICYAKSHLLAALLRAIGIPTGFCYQRLILDDKTKPYLILHGLNAVYIKSLRKWVRIDARGNKAGVDAQFSVENEKLAFPIRKEWGEEDIMTVFSDPDANVVKALGAYTTVSELFDHLPKELFV